MPLASSELLGATAAICVLCSPTERKPFLLPCCAPPDKTDTPRGGEGMAAAGREIQGCSAWGGGAQRWSWWRE